MAQSSSQIQRHLVIIGAGAAGLLAAGSVQNCRISVLDHNEKPGKKLYITGKGRCNVTNDCTVEEFLGHVVTNSKFLYSSVYGFTPQDLQATIEQNGVPLKTERGNRVFPVSDKSSDIIRALYARAQKNGAQFYFGRHVTHIERCDMGFKVHTEHQVYICDDLLIATGGKSYAATGSTGDGYKFAERFGHRIVSPVPSLVPMLTKQDVSALAGLTLKNVSVRLCTDKKEYAQFGELLYTHNGVSGPVILRLSAYARRHAMPMQMYIDFKPALDTETLDKRVFSDLIQFANKQLKHALEKLLPKAMILPVLQQCQIDADKKANILRKEERQSIVHALKNFRYDVTALGGFENAVITAGGVDVRDIDPKTMQSKIVPHLYFAGEILDVDALTGGFNLQIAFSTAQAAAKAISQQV